MPDNGRESLVAQVSEIKGMLTILVEMQTKAIEELTKRVRALEYRVWFAMGIGSAISLFFGYLLHIWGTK